MKVRWQVSRDIYRAKASFACRLDLNELQVKFRNHSLHSRKESVSHREDSRMDAFWPGDGERRCPFSPKHRIHQEKGNASTMISMNVCADDRADGIVINSLGFQRDQR
jgi:hypothetical protein